MDFLINGKVKNAIKNDLGLDKQKLDEALVAQQKQFDLKTDFLSGRNKQNHIELYDQYVKDFNRISAELDGVDRSASNSTLQTYRI
jgi:hypothetical protein